MRRFGFALSLVVAGFAQTAKAPAPKAPSKTSTAKKALTVSGFAVAPPVLADEGCARDYMHMFEAEGVEQRKRLSDLFAYHCLDGTAKGIFSAVAIDRKDFAVTKGETAFFFLVRMAFDKERTQKAIGGPEVFLISPPAASYSGWVPEEDFYAVSEQEFDKLLAAGKIRINLGR